MSYLKDQPWFTSLMDKGDTIGECANCRKVVRESQFCLDDCYGVYRGRCPYCNAVNLLDQSGKHGIRGYSDQEIFLTLPTDHEIKMNDWESDIPTIPCTCHECK